MQLEMSHQSQASFLSGVWHNGGRHNLEGVDGNGVQRTCRRVATTLVRVFNTLFSVRGLNETSDAPLTRVDRDVSVVGLLSEVVNHSQEKTEKKEHDSRTECWSDDMFALLLSCRQ